MVTLALLALFCFNIGTPGEAQMPDGIDREQGLSSSDIATFLRQLENTKEDGIDELEQSAWKSRTFSDIDRLIMNLDGSLESRDLVHKDNLKKNQTDNCSLWCRIKKAGKKMFKKVKGYVSYIMNKGPKEAEKPSPGKE